MAVNWLILLLLGLLSLSGSASSLRTLNTVKELNDTGFGQPPPRHGYVLLLWYVQNCVDNNMVALCNPKAGEYGFHYFRNSGKGSQTLLPKLDKHGEYGYYSLGNLNYKHAGDLPYEVRRYYDKHDKRSNMDRLLVKYFYNKNLIEEIYVSAHYEKSQTYLIGPSLVSDLRQKRALHQPPSKQWYLTIVQSNNNRYYETM